MLLVAAMAMSMLTGCGSKPAGNDAQSAASSEASKETEAAAETPASAEDETLTVWCWDPNFNVYAMKQAEKAYQVDHPNFKLDIQEKVYSDIETALITAAEAGDYSTLPDIFLMQDYSFHKMQPIIPESSQHWMTAELISPSSLWVSWLTPL